jgi:hypothetical protein
MAPFDELQALWQSQAAVAARAFDPTALATEFRRFGRRQDIINASKSVLVVFAFVQTVEMFPSRPLAGISLMLILCTATLALIVEWRIQRSIARLNFTAPSLDFVRGSIARLQAQRNPYHTPAYLTMFAAVLIGYNVLTLANWPRLTIERRILSHAVATASPAILYVFGRWVRAKRWNAEYRPLIERLSVLLETLEECAQ